ncbi:hypothetical protein ACWCPJ_23345 [Streptomyces collinus]
MGMKSKIALNAVVGVIVIGVVSANAGTDGKGGGTGTGGKGSAAHHGGAKAAKDPAGAKAAGRCSRERTKDAEQRLDSITANDDVTGTAVVTVRATDACFRTTGCGDRKPTG